ncbi:MAG: Lrp/AsnC ligand binding domain-containing protein [Candidatus Thermoplasmatota archaeon]|nr:Lrp/AsnC ligand binding domain-containing protein [Candidatus Thermoplasmatota archaeon]
MKWVENNMINAYMFMNVEPGCSQQTLTRMRRVNQIESVSVVSGDHDLIARVSVDDLERLHDITAEVHCIRGVMKTNTHVISKEINVGK